MKKITLIGSCCMLLFCCAGKAQTISTVAGDGVTGYLGDGSAATAAEISQPGDVAFDAAGNFYIVDVFNAVIREVNTSGVISTVAGSGTSGYSGDGGQATLAKFNIPGGVAVDNAGNIYIADRDNDRIRKVTKASGIITTIAGTGVAGYNGDGIAATTAQINFPNGGIVVDGSGNVFFGESGNNRVREINASNGNIYTVVGTGVAGFSGDGAQATAAQISLPYGIALDGSGNLFLADQNNNRIRMVTKATGIITTIAGNGTNGNAGNGGAATAAELNRPGFITVDAQGSVYISDTYNNEIRKVAYYNNNIYPLAGTGVMSYSGDGGPATAADLYEPLGLSISPLTGGLYVSDWGNYRIRMLTSPLAVNEVLQNTDMLAYPNPAGQTLFVKCGSRAGEATISVHDVLGKEVLSQHVNTQQGTIQLDVATLAKGMYFVNVTSDKMNYVTRFIKN